MKRGLTWRVAAMWVGSVAVAVVFLAPLLWAVAGSFREEAAIFRLDASSLWDVDTWTLSNYADGWRRAALGPALLVSVAQVALIVGGGLIVNALAAYAFARMTFRGRDGLFAAVVMLIILPVEVIAVPMFFTARDLGLTGEFGAAMAGLTLPFMAKAFNIYFLRQHFLALPVQLEEAAAMDGAGVWTQFWRVALPSVKPALATVVVLDVLTHWGDFLWPLMIGTRESTRTVQIGLANLFTQPPVQWGDILACAVMATLPVLLMFRWLQRYIVATQVQTGIK
ncbi:ABC transporter permease [Nibricoccus aquaticus]|uniref:sn-glycerol-3-phosphate transport system permease protein UgpE n=1 Tax=Nibricoccus aquaticus TaxID=2576891 RepID=A0A290QFI4_9BACT|nr:carbohydrate ABC transporter permease [Nibricoccus aquaticus]ATC63111.1 ABC transporter permease [Nibricoccus aquaticus]